MGLLLDGSFFRRGFAVFSLLGSTFLTSGLVAFLANSSGQRSMGHVYCYCFGLVLTWWFCDDWRFSIDFMRCIGNQPSHVSTRVTNSMMFFPNERKPRSCTGDQPDRSRGHFLLIDFWGSHLLITKITKRVFYASHGECPSRA